MQLSAKSFRNIGLIGRPDKSSVVDTLSLIHDHLLSLGLHPVFDTETAALVPYPNTQTVRKSMLGEVVDMVHYGITDTQYQAKKSQANL